MYHLMPNYVIPNAPIFDFMNDTGKFLYTTDVITANRITPIVIKLNEIAIFCSEF